MFVLVYLFVNIKYFSYLCTRITKQKKPTSTGIDIGFDIFLMLTNKNPCRA